jgi:hypothetical protein
MTQQVILKTFFHQLVEVVDQLIEMFPTDQNFKIFKTFIGMLQKSNPTLVISTFHEHVSQKYEKQIDSRNEEFLTSYKPIEYGADVTDILASVRPHWNTLSQSSRDSLWMYIYILKELTKKYYALNI